MTDTTTSTTADNNRNTNTPVNTDRKVIGYVKQQPGYRVTINLFLIFVLITALSGGFALFAYLSPVEHPQNPLDEFDIYDIVGFYVFCAWNSIMWAMIILIPSLTTVNREKCLPLFYLSGCSVFMVRASDFVIPATTFQIISSVAFNFFSYLIYMAIFVVLYGLPDDMYLSSRMSSMKPWRPVYEEEELPTTRTRT